MSVFFFFKQKTAYEMRISDWSSDVCSSDLLLLADVEVRDRGAGRRTDCLGAHIVSALCRELGGARGFGVHHLIDGNMMIAAIVEGVRVRGNDQPAEAKCSQPPDMQHHREPENASDPREDEPTDGIDGHVVRGATDVRALVAGRVPVRQPNAERTL